MAVCGETPYFRITCIAGARPCKHERKKCRKSDNLSGRTAGSEGYQSAKCGKRGAGYRAEAAIAQRCRPRQAAGHAREGSGDLADLDLGASAGRDPRSVDRPLRARTETRRDGCDRRRQPAASLLGVHRGAGARRDSGAGLPGLRCRRDGLRPGARRGCVRDCREPGAGRQGAVDRRPRADPALHGLLRSARPQEVRPYLAQVVRRDSADRPRGAAQEPAARRMVALRDRPRQGQRHVGHALYVGNDGQTEGRDPHPHQRRRLRPERQHFRSFHAG